MRLLAIIGVLLLAGCATPVTKADGPDFGYGDYFRSPHEFSSWVQVGCYDHGRRVAETMCD